MEQSTITDQDRRWAEAVAKLTAMTYDGRLKWRQNEYTTNPTFIRRIFGANLADQTFNVLIDTPLVGENGAEDRKTSRPFFNAFQNLKTVKSLGNITVVRALADAILSTTEDETQREEELLRAIESA